MKKTASLCRRRPYVYSFYLKKDISDAISVYDFPCMTHAFYGESLSYISKYVQKLLMTYLALGIRLEAVLEDNLEAIDVEDIVQHYDTQLKFDF